MGHYLWLIGLAVSQVIRIGFIDALRWPAEAEPGEEFPELVVNPARPGRVDPRVIKGRPRNIPRMTEPARVFRERLLSREDAVEVVH